LGTGDVAQTVAEALSAAGHDVVFGSRDSPSKAHLDHDVVLWWILPLAPDVPSA